MAFDDFQLLTLLMYLGTVKHRSNELVEKLEDTLTFTKEIRHRFKCVFQVTGILIFFLTYSILR
jgi:hypothetical protein